jgi:SAM-dependent methyltransferase
LEESVQRRAGQPAGSAEPSLADRVRRGLPVRAHELDRVYPERDHDTWAAFWWTPALIAKRAAELLVEGTRAARVLDVGAGIGKFCVVGALTTSASFTGIEHRPHLVELGRRTVEVLGVPRVRLVHGTLRDIPWKEFDAFYLFNPFEENRPRRDRLDQTVDLTEARFLEDVGLVELALGQAPIGTRVATYCGFGGRIPFAYDLVHQERHKGGFLRLWVKERDESVPTRGYLDAPTYGP